MTLPIEFYSLRRNVKRSIFGPGTLESTAFEKEILCPSEVVEAPPAIYLAGQLERVAGVPPESTKEREIELVTLRKVTHAATIAYHIRNAVLIDGSIYASTLRYPLAEKSFFSSGSAAPAYFENAALASSLLGHRYFGHWLRDDCVTHILAERFAKPLCIRTSFPAASHLSKYKEYFGQVWSYTDRAHIDHLIVFQDYAQNRLKHDRYVTLGKRITDRFGHKGQTPFVYLRRGNTGVPRLIQNECEIMEALSTKGFKIVDIESQSLESVLESLASAQVVVSIEGSHIAHCPFSVPNKSALLVLQPADRFASIYRGWTMCLGVRFGLVVGDRGGSGYAFSVPEILSTLDLMMKEL